jgi:hypothetical protein
VCHSAAVPAPFAGASDSTARISRILAAGASAGPLPVAQSIRGAWLSLAIAPICLISGAVLAAVYEWFPSRNTL